MVTTHPDDAVSYVGGSATFSVIASGTATPAYQWRFNGLPISGAVGATLSLNNLTAAQAGGYTVAVNNGAGTVVSRIAHLCVTPQQNGPVEYSFSPRYPIPDGMIFRDSVHTGSNFFAVGDNGIVISSSDGINWNAQDSTVGVSLFGLAFGNGMLVAVGDEGCALSSPDGINWWQRTSGSLQSLKSVTYGAGRFVAVGSAGTVLTSPDGIAWTVRNSGSVANWSGVGFGNGLFIAVGSGGAIMTSSDGVVWTSRSSGVTQDLRRAFYGGAKFIVVGSAGTILSSADGINWTSRSVNTSGSALVGGGYGNSTFVVVGENGNMWASTNGGLNWLVVGGLPSPNSHLHSVVFGSSLFVTMGDEVLMSSADAIGWTKRGQGVDGVAGYSTGFTENDGSYVLIPQFDDWTFAHSTDGLTWVRQPIQAPSSTFGPYSLSYGNGKFVAFGSGMNVGEGIWTSSDGINWGQSSLGNSSSKIFDAFYRGIFAGGRFVYGGYRATTIAQYSYTFQDLIASSTDGQQWSNVQLLGNVVSDATTSINGIAYGNGLYVAVGAGGKVYTSSDSSIWTRRLSGTTSDIGGVVFASGKFVAVTESSNVIESEDGIAWSVSTAPWRVGGDPYNHPKPIVGCKGRFFAIGSDSYSWSDNPGRGSIYESLDGMSWKPSQSGGTHPPRGLTTIGNRVFGLGSSLSLAIARPSTAPTPSILTSPSDGATLTSDTTSFIWDAGIGVTQYALWIGSAPDSYDLYASLETGGNRSRTVSLPNDGRKLYVTVWSWISGAWQKKTSTVSASSPSWHSRQLTVTPNMADGMRTGVVHDSWYLYYYKGIDNHLWASYWTGSQWAQAPLTTTPNVDDWLSFHSAYGCLYYKGTDGHLWAVWFAEAKWNQTAITTTANVAGDVAVDTLWNIVYYRGTDNKLWAAWYGGGKWNQAPLTPLTNVAGSLSIDSSFHLIYYKGSDGHLWVCYVNGSAWTQAKLSTSANIGGAVTADNNGVIYYRSSADGSPWAVYWTGSIWAQGVLDATLGLGGGGSVMAMFTPYLPVYLNGNGRGCALSLVNGKWVSSVLGDGGSGLTGGLSVYKANSWIFSRRNDGHLVMFYFR